MGERRAHCCTSVCPPPTIITRPPNTGSQDHDPALAVAALRQETGNIYATILSALITLNSKLFLLENINQHNAEYIVFNTRYVLVLCNIIKQT